MSHDSFGIFSSLLSSLLFHINDANICDSCFIGDDCQGSYIKLECSASREGKEATYMDIPLLLKLKCLELPFPPTFTRVSVLLTFLSIS